MTNLTLKKAVREKVKMKLALQGPSGSGKTYSALLLAFGITQDWSKIAVIDTENASASLYADLGEYNTIELSAPYSPDRYCEALTMCAQSGMEVVIVDSITHEWQWCLNYHASLPGNSFTNWSKVNPLHQRFVNKMLQLPLHIIATTRTKQDYEISRDTSGKTKVNKLGTKTVQRDGLEYEFTIAFDLDMSHNATTSKDRTGLFMGKALQMITSEIGETIKTWCETGKEPAVRPTENYVPNDASHEEIADLLLGGEVKAKKMATEKFEKMCIEIEKADRFYWDNVVFGKGNNLVVITSLKFGKMLYQLTKKQIKVMKQKQSEFKLKVEGGEEAVEQETLIEKKMRA